MDKLRSFMKKEWEFSKSKIRKMKKNGYKIWKNGHKVWKNGRNRSLWKGGGKEKKEKNGKKRSIGMEGGEGKSEEATGEWNGESYKIHQKLKEKNIKPIKRETAKI